MDQLIGSHGVIIFWKFICQRDPKWPWDHAFHIHHQGRHALGSMGTTPPPLLKGWRGGGGVYSWLFSMSVHSFVDIFDQVFTYPRIQHVYICYIYTYIFGCGSKLYSWGYAGVSLCFYIPSCNFGYHSLSHSHLGSTHTQREFHISWSQHIPIISADAQQPDIWSQHRALGSTHLRRCTFIVSELAGGNGGAL